MRVDHYDFGKVVVNGRKYHQDIIITRSGVKSWWRVKGHEVCVEDLKPLEAEDLEVLVIGTGYNGMVKVLREVEEWAERRGVQLIAVPTRIACDAYNERLREAKVAAALHLTC